MWKREKEIKMVHPIPLLSYKLSVSVKENPDKKRKKKQPFRSLLKIYAWWSRFLVRTFQVVLFHHCFLNGVWNFLEHPSLTVLVRSSLLKKDYLADKQTNAWQANEWGTNKFLDNSSRTIVNYEHDSLLDTAHQIIGSRALDTPFFSTTDKFFLWPLFMYGIQLPQG